MKSVIIRNAASNSLTAWADAAESESVVEAFGAARDSAATPALSRWERVRDSRARRADTGPTALQSTSFCL